MTYRPQIKPVIYLNQENPDLDRMIYSYKFREAMFVFADNLLDYQTANSGPLNDTLRTYNVFDPKHYFFPRSFGIPLGYSLWMSFQSLEDKIDGDRTVRDLIDDEIQILFYLVDRHKHSQLIFLAQPGDHPGDYPILRPRYATVPREILNYVSKKIYALGDYYGE
jgi:hypothetical protein